MADSFNPYRRWLELDIAGSPASYYQLLGLETFEEDREQITRRADAAMTKIRSQRPGEHARRWAQLLDELAAAKECLLDKEKKTLYDTQLKQGHTHNLADFEITPPITPPLEPRTERTEIQEPQKQINDTSFNTSSSKLPANQRMNDLPDTPGDPMAPYVPPSIEAGTPMPGKPEAVLLIKQDNSASYDASDHSHVNIPDDDESLFKSQRLRNYRKTVAGSNPAGNHLRGVIFVVLALTVTVSILLFMLSENNFFSIAQKSDLNVVHEDDQANNPNSRLAKSPSNTKMSEDFTLPLPGKNVKNQNSNLLPPVTTPPETNSLSEEELAKLGSHLKTVRQALTDRKLTFAAEEMAKAQQLAKGSRYETVTSRLDLLRQYVQQFWVELEKAKKSLRSTQELNLANNEIAIIVSVSPQELVLKRRGRTNSYEMQNLPFPLMLSIADQWLSENNPATYFVKGAIQAVDSNGSEEKAKKLWQQATGSADEVSDLIQAMEDRYDFTE